MPGRRRERDRRSAVRRPAAPLRAASERSGALRRLPGASRCRPSRTRCSRKPAVRHHVGLSSPSSSARTAHPRTPSLVVQREAAARTAACPGDPGRSAAQFFAPSVVHRFRRHDFAPTPSVEVVMLRLRKRGPLVAADDAKAYRDLVVSGFTAWRPTISAALARSLGPRAVGRLLDAADLDPALRPAQVPFDEWLRLFAAFTRMPDACSDLRASPARDARLCRQQSSSAEGASLADAARRARIVVAESSRRLSRSHLGPLAGAPAMLSGWTIRRRS